MKLLVRKVGFGGRGEQARNLQGDVVAGEVEEEEGDDGDASGWVACLGEGAGKTRHHDVADQHGCGRGEEEDTAAESVDAECSSDGEDEVPDLEACLSRLLVVLFPTSRVERNR